jgi:hypothetical protein
MDYANNGRSKSEQEAKKTACVQYELPCFQRDTFCVQYAFSYCSQRNPMSHLDLRVV